jgi:stage II sporulation protein D
MIQRAYYRGATLALVSFLCAIPMRLKPSSPLYVRVLLDEKNFEAGPLWHLSGTGNFIISDLKDSARRQTVKASQLSIEIQHDGTLVINGKRLAPQSIKIEPTAGSVTHGHHRYKGSFYIVKSQRTLQLINRIGLEDYVDSGVRWEMLPGWPAAALEAGAIAYRTYVVASVRAARTLCKKRGRELWYDIKCTPVHQVYKGIHECACIHEAVKRTKGLILTYKKEPIMALYDACCGGSIPARRQGIDFIKAPYLARAYPCNYCRKCKYYEWSRLYTLQELGICLRSYTHKHGALTDIKITKKDKAGAVCELKAKINRSWIAIPGSKIPSILKDIKSCSFTFSKRGRVIKISGRGYGHQIGFCQWGAYGLAQKGWDFWRILRFYYPGAVIMKAEGIL